MPNETIQVRDKAVLVSNQSLSEERVAVTTDDLTDYDLLEELSSEGAGPYRVFYFLRNDENTPMFPTGGEYAIDAPYQIPANHYFVLGDNRDNSIDSRYRGTVPKELIFGKAAMIYWSSKPDASGDEKIKWTRIFTTPKDWNQR